MTAITVLTAAMETCGMGRLTPSMVSTDPEVQRFIRHMNEAGRDASRRGEWARMYRTSLVAAGDLSTALPADFQEMAEGGAVVMSDGLLARPIVSPEQWNFIENQLSTQTYYHIRSGNVLFNRNTGGATIHYVSNQWVFQKDATNDDADTFLIPERLVELGTVWRWKRQRGEAYDDFLAEYEADLQADLVADRGA